MKVIEKISEIIGKYMALIVLAVAALALFVPQSSLWIDTSWINYLLMIVMFGMRSEERRVGKECSHQ